MDSLYKVKLEGFEGPLDLLLSFIEKRKLHINDISLAKITDDYLARIEGLGSFPIKEAAHFILIASTLVLIKSRSLLPFLKLTEEEEDDIDSLERQLKEYKRVKELSERVQAQFDKRIIFTAEHTARITPIFSPTKKITIGNLLLSIKRVLSGLPRKEMLPQVIINKVISLEETISALSERITKDICTRFGDFANINKADRINVIVSFLAMLELIKRGIIIVKQNKHFEDIVISKKL